MTSTILDAFDARVDPPEVMFRLIDRMQSRRIANQRQIVALLEANNIPHEVSALVQNQGGEGCVCVSVLVVAWRRMCILNPWAPVAS